jgi:hypothetical protein
MEKVQKKFQLGENKFVFPKKPKLIPREGMQAAGNLGRPAGTT